MDKRTWVQELISGICLVFNPGFQVVSSIYLLMKGMTVLPATCVEKDR